MAAKWTEAEARALMDELADWFKARGIPPDEAVAAMAGVISAALAHQARDREHLDKALEFLRVALDGQAREFFRFRCERRERKG